MRLTLQDLRDLCDQYADADPKTPVRLAFQPKWPFAYHATVAEMVEADGENPAAVYIACGNQIDYLATGAREAIGWADESDD